MIYKGRYVGENMRTLADLVKISKSENITGFIARLDFEKAFYAVQMAFFFTTGQTMELDPSYMYISWIKVLYRNT